MATATNLTIWEALPPFSHYKGTHIIRNAKIPSAEAQLCANWVALRKSVVLLAKYIILRKRPAEFPQGAIVLLFFKFVYAKYFVCIKV